VRISVVTVSDRASRGEYEDLSGPALAAVLAEAYPGAEIERQTVPDDEELILAAFGRSGDADWIITCGGTGPAARDRTPEASRAWIDRELPGIAEALRAASGRETPFAAFSRGIAGMRGRQFLVNVPGSPAAARLCAAILAPLLGHGLEMVRGGGHGEALKKP
jgi:molybdenum cofactor biosynthesis protein B